MYKSVPMLLSYVLLLCYSGVSSAYEFYMGIACSKNDCMAEQLVNNDASKYEEFTSEYPDVIVTIGIFWKLR